MFTEIVKIIGSSGGTTVVIIRIHLKNSLFLSLDPSSNPLTNTYPEEIKEKTSKMNIKAKASVYLIYKFSLLNRTVLINFPFEVSNPVFKTTAMQSSVAFLDLTHSGRSLLDPKVYKTSVPQNSTEVLCLIFKSKSSSGLTFSMESLI